MDRRAEDGLIPTRFQDTKEARQRFGEQLDRLSPFLLKVDGPADRVVEAFAELPKSEGFHLLEAALARGIDAVPAAPPALRELFAEVDHVPFWVDWEALDRGGAAFLRAGMLGGLLLGLQSLMFGYASPGGNKPLAFSGRLRAQAQRRLAETSRFVYAVSQAGGMRRFGEGFAITVKVRIMHAQVRRMLLSSGRWRADLWGAPINQHDMAATTLLFSLTVLDGMDKLNYRLSPADKEALIHVWRYVGHVIGVDHELLPASMAEAKRLAEMILATQGEPDDDSRALAEALLHYPLNSAPTPSARRRVEKRMPIIYGVCRTVLGDELAGKLGVPRTNFRLVLPLMRAIVATSGRAHGLSPLRGLALDLGERYWQRAIAVGLGDRPADFAPPEHFVDAQ